MDTYDPHEQTRPTRTPAARFPGHSWRKPAACGPNSGNCVEVNLAAPGLVGVRDSKNGDSPVLVFDRGEWASFVEAVRRGEFDG